jgi:PAS domain S-box-containing protein
MSPRLVLAVALAFSALCSWSQEKGTERPVVRIARVSIGGAEQPPGSPNPLAQYLESQVPGYSFQVTELPTNEALEDAFQNGRLEFAIVYTLRFPAWEVRYGARAIASMMYGNSPGKESAQFGSAIICRRDASGIRQLSDLRGKRVIVFTERTMGWVAAWREFVDLGINPFRDFAELRFGSTLADPGSLAVVGAVRQGRADAGVLSGRVLERVAPDYETWARVLPAPRPDPESQGHPYPLSTRLYPTQPFVKAPHTSITLATAVTVALLNMPRDSEAARWANSPGFTLPLNYEPVHECLRELRLDPYTDYGKVTLAGAIEQHWGAAMLLLALVSLSLAASTWYVARLNRRLHRSLESLDYQGQLLAQTGEAILAAAPDGRITFLNRAAETLLGCGREEALGSQAEQVLQLNGGGEPGPKTLAQLAGNFGWSGERAIHRGSGEPRRVELSVSALRGSAGEAAGTVACIRDVTALRSLEEQYRQAQKLESIGRLAGGVAHDFNNLLTVINGYSQLLMDRVGQDQTLLPSLTAILQAGERAAGLTRQLLAFSRKQTLQPKVLNLNRVVAGIEPMLRRVIGEPINVVMALAPSLGSVKADAGQIEQAILNLTVNARDAMPEGGTLLIETAGVELDEHYAQDHADISPGTYVMLAVSDTGHGMDETTRRRLFEPFFTTKEPGKGTGLGLATVYGIVKQSGGHIWVYSELGSGTTFKLYFPRVDAEAAEESPAAMVVRGGKERILLVEDEVGVRALAASILTENGYCVWPASCGEDARQIALARESEIDLLLTDVVMPDTTGPRLATQLRTICPDLRVLYTSGYTDNVIVHNGMVDPGVAYLQKPFTPALLLNAVRQVLDT